MTATKKDYSAMKFTQSQMQLVAACLAIGFEGACDNSVDAGGENTNEDLAEVAAFMVIIESHLRHVGDTTLRMTSGLLTGEGERKPSELFTLALARDAIVAEAQKREAEILAA